ncbi:hypothetical protein [Amycolatopsis sp. WQ 127309]|uniref:hypothetical protein n=1 Tax=Amycolatopsis sp. WQ 127309 TaxID=2932773 RepID=UPI001FF6AA6C|nr:hypothetical protein [Amycolatopsis sp. WQ 127309]UOZ10669.1 hypothetical protein MUY22_21355 [Amycolatopsis sp. WQ 127309]
METESLGSTLGRKGNPIARRSPFFDAPGRYCLALVAAAAVLVVRDIAVRRLDRTQKPPRGGQSARRPV